MITVSRRTFIEGLGLGLGGLALGLYSRNTWADEPSGDAGPRADPGSNAIEDSAPGLNPSVFLHLAADGGLTLVCARSEMGQGIRSTIPVLIADELGADPARVRLLQADGDKKYGDQNTDGSTSIRKFDENLRKVGATAREMLIAAAARQWKVQPRECRAENHAVVHPRSKRSLQFGALALAASKLPVPQKPALKEWSELTRVSSEKLPLVDGPDVVTGKAVFGADVKLPGMLIAVIARPPVAGGRPARFDAARALAVPGVKKVFELPAAQAPFGFQPWGGVAVVADHTWAAMRGRAALDITWEHGENQSYDSERFRETLLEAVRAPGTTFRKLGDVDAALQTAATVLQAEYFVPHLAQLPMEPPAAIARVADGKCEIWAATQHPQAARSEAARALGMSEENVTVHVTLLGGGFGRKSKADFAGEAALVAREAGTPVRVQWTRDDDVRHCYYNTVNAQRIRAGLDAGGKLVAWHQRTAFPPIASTFAKGATQPKDSDLQQGVLDLVLDAPNVRSEACAAKAQVRIGWYRSVYNIFHAFSAGSMIDEIAHARQADPRDVWLEVIGPAKVWSLKDLGIEALRNYGETLEKHPVDAGRLRNVVERVTEACGWKDRAGRALGLAAHRSFVTYSACVVSVVPDPVRGIRVDQAWISMDAGRVVNRDRAHAQMEGAVVMGISNALLGGITMKNGATVESNFRDAKIARIGETPRVIHTDLVPSEAAPGGVGEPAVPPVGPALANAIFALTGKRLREIPLARALRAAMAPPA